jgi:hypothetical protein
LPLPDQIEFVRRNWPEIVRRFGPTQREDTHSRLGLLRKERAKRLFPGVYPRARTT